VDAILLALASAVSFGAMTVSLRAALKRHPEPDVGAVATTVVAALVAVVAIAFERGGGEAASSKELAIFALAGLLAPGVSQIFFTLAVKEVGASRTSVIAGSAPLFAATLAIILLDEPFEWPLALGALLIVGAGALLVGDTKRALDFRLVGIGYALLATALFTSRDVVVRWYSEDAALGSVEAAAAALGAGAVVMLVWAAIERRGALVAAFASPLLVRFVAPGFFFGLSYVLLFAAVYRGKLTVVSPLVATESLWGVAFSALFLHRVEVIGLRLALGATAIVAGGVLIGIFR
jgi:drug/metabolite transporter (DMT)-like permease